MFNAGVLLWLLERRLGGLEGGRIAVAFAKILAASLAMGIAAAYTSSWLTVLFPGTQTLLKSVRVFSSIAVGVLVLLAASRALRIEEFDLALDRVWQRVLPTR